MARGADVAGRAGAPEDVSRGRVEALSDGVFAIVLTLLVLEIRVPHVEAPAHVDALARALLALLPKFVAWVVSFVTVCVIWVSHHRLFHQMARVDHALFWHNANLLLWTSFIPFPTALLGDYPASPLAASLYGAVLALMALAFVLLRRRMMAIPGLLHPDADREAFRRGTRASVLMGPVAYLAGVALAWLLVPAALLVYAAIPAFFVLRRGERLATPS